MRSITRAVTGGGAGGGSGTIGGTIANTQVAFGTAADTIGGEAAFVYDATTNGLTVGGTTPYVVDFAAFEPGNDPLSAINYATGTITTVQAGPYPNYGEFNTLHSLFATINPSTDDPDYNVYVGSIVQAVVPSTAAKSWTESMGLLVNLAINGGGSTSQFPTGLNVSVAQNVATTGTVIAANFGATATATTSKITTNYNVAAVNAASVTTLQNFYSTVSLRNAAAVTNLYWYYIDYFSAGGSTVGTAIGYWCRELSTLAATNAYSFWHDAQGVFRIREDNTFNAVYQAIPALYNPQFTKYTPGATNFERVVLQWESNVATLTTEKGGTGALRALNLGDTGVQVKVNSQNLTLAGALTTSGANALTLTTTGATNVTLPTSGTLLTTTGSGASLTFPGTLSIASGKTFTGSNTLTFTGTDGSTVACGAGGTVLYNTSVISSWGGNLNQNSIAASTTQYIGPSFNAASSTVNLRQWICPSAGSLKYLYLKTSSTQPASGSMVVSIYVNGTTASAVTFTIAANATANTFSDTSNSVAVAAGDKIVVGCLNNASAGSAGIEGWGFSLVAA